MSDEDGSVTRALVAMRRERDAALEALRPFAEMWDKRFEQAGDWSAGNWELAFESWADRDVGSAVTVSWGQLRSAARAILSGPESSPAETFGHCENPDCPGCNVAESPPAAKPEGSPKVSTE